MKKLRTAFRLLRALLHLLQGCLTVALVYPCLSESRRLLLKQRWSHQLLGLLGVHLRFEGTPTGQQALPSGLVVANHISFLDIFVLNAIAPAGFVSKDDVRRWPIIGWLSAHTDTLFLERGSRNAAQRARENLVAQLRQGKRIALFPEGTTSRGDSVLPFHSALLQAAIDAGCEITPVALRYRAVDGEPTHAPAYVDEVSLFECLRKIAGERNLYVEVAALAPLGTADAERRALSAHVHRLITHRLHDKLNPPIVSAVAG